ncbi:MAG: peptide ABC transporter substrate-binding protein [Verrucomicrobia bacterium]|nr:peptide ABC transporter substrate-binding protein [Verrucomicrobiota bacterium]
MGLWVNVFFAILALLTFSCQHSPEKKSTLRLNIGHEPASLDPRKVRDANSSTLVRMLFEGLTRMGREQITELALAKDVELSEDLCTYTFHLRESVWSDGTPLTATDFVCAWKSLLDPAFPSDTAYYLYILKNGKKIREGSLPVDALRVEAVDALTLRVELEHPAPYFLELLAFPAFFPVSARDETVSNGPFQLAAWHHQDEVLLEKSPTYWDAGAVRLERIAFCMVEEGTELNMFERGELDWAGSPLSQLPLDSLAALREKKWLQSRELLGTKFIRLNTGKFPFDNMHLRQAFALAVDRRAIVDYVYQGNQIPATGLVPLSLGLQEAPYFEDGNLRVARELFAEALKEMNLKELPEVVITYLAGEGNHLLSQTLQQQWFEAFGVRVRLEAIEWKVYNDRLSKLDYQIAPGSWSADFSDPVNFLGVFQHRMGGSNNTYWESSRFNELLECSARVVGKDARKKLLRESEEILMKEMPVIPVFYFTMLYVNQPDLNDVVLSPMGIVDFKWAWKTEKTL